MSQTEKLTRDLTEHSEHVYHQGLIMGLLTAQEIALRVILNTAETNINGAREVLEKIEQALSEERKVL